MLTALVAVAGALTAMGSFGVVAKAEAAPETRWTSCEGGTQTPDLQCNFPRGVASNPANGHVYVGDQSNHRVIELNARGELLKGWGWGVAEDPDEGPQAAEFQICTPETGCFKGLNGAGEGQFAFPQGVAADSEGAIYVVDFSNRRVQKFAPDGSFELMFGGEVNKTKVEEGGKTEAEENLCPFDPGDECQKGVQGAGNGQFGAWKVGSFIATDPSDNVYVGDVGRIQRFDVGGGFQDECSVPKTVQGLAADAADLYAIYDNERGVRKLDYVPGGECAETARFDIPEPDEFTKPAPTAVAVGGEAHVFAFSNAATGNGFAPLDRIFEFDGEGNVVDSFGKGEYDASNGLATNLCEGSEAPGNVYVANTRTNGFIRAYGTEPVGCLRAVTEAADPVEEFAATLNGSVNPKGEAVESCFFQWGETSAYGKKAECDPNAAAIGTGSEPVAVKAELEGLQKGTVYHFRLVADVGGETETGADESFKTLGPPVISEDHVASVTDTEAKLRALANPEGFATECHFAYGEEGAFDRATAPRAIGEDREEHLLAATVGGLEPGTAYRWRVVCENSSGLNEGPQRTFDTYRIPSPDTGCPNQGLRTEAGAFLPDCRAYEMVSPVDKNGGDIVLLADGNVQAAPDGGKITYNTLPAFGDAANAYAINQYLAERTERGQPGEGWSNHGIHPPAVGETVVNTIINLGLVRDFMGFTPDLCSAWIFDYLEPSFTPEGQEGYADFYRRENCGPGEGELEALMPSPPHLPQGTAQDYLEPTYLRGVSDDGSRAVFVAQTPLLQDCRTTTSADAIGYQWLRDGVEIEGATGAVYRATAADEGKSLQCQVFALNENSGSTQVANPPSIIPSDPSVELKPPTAPPAIAAPVAGAPLTVGGAGGQTLTCEPGGWEGASSFSYRWYRNGVPIDGASSTAYIATEADLSAPAVFQCAVTGANEDGKVAKVSANRATAPAPSGPAPPSVSANVGGDRARVYVRFGGELHLVNVRPGGRIGESDSGVGVGPRALSSDGSRVYWIYGPFARDFDEGKIFLRVHPEQGIVADECEGAEKACTLPVSAGGEASFLAASTDGSRALYSEEGELHEFRLSGEETENRLVAKALGGLIGASEDLSQVYFVSPEDLTGPQENALGEVAIEGELNLYLDEGEKKTFVVGLDKAELGAGQLGIGGRVSPDGSRLVFQSRARLSGYDNTDQENGKADVEVFAYDAETGELECISCNPSGARPVGRELRRRYWATPEGSGAGVFAAAWIPAPEHPLHASNVVSADGERIFFNSNDALLARDTNGTMDVYQWEAVGKGGCEEGSPSYFPQNGGCLDLISSGESPFESEFWEASESGEDVFFTTESGLLPKDPGLVDLYDARVGGGFPEAVGKEACEGEACQSAPPPPAYQTPASRSYQGPEDTRPLPDCRAGARRAAALSRRAKRARRAARRAKGPAARKRARRARGLAKRAGRLSKRAKRCRRQARRAQR